MVVVAVLIQAGADVRKADKDGNTPMKVATRYEAGEGHDVVEGLRAASLIQVGADARKADKDGCTPMQVATAMKREKVVTLLRDYERV